MVFAQTCEQWAFTVFLVGIGLLRVDMAKSGFRFRFLFDWQGFAGTLAIAVISLESWKMVKIAYYGEKIWQYEKRF